MSTIEDKIEKDCLAKYIRCPDCEPDYGCDKCDHGFVLYSPAKCIDCMGTRQVLQTVYEAVGNYSHDAQHHKLVKCQTCKGTGLK